MMYDLKEHYEKFISRIKNNQYACFVVEELDQQKFLCWSVENKVRFIIQDYNHENVEIKMDVLIDKQIFLNEINKAVKQAIIEKDKVIEEVLIQLKK